jgi:hypothetical protein
MAQLPNDILLLIVQYAHASFMKDMTVQGWISVHYNGATWAREGCMYAATPSLRILCYDWSTLCSVCRTPYQAEERVIRYARINANLPLVMKVHVY